MKNHIPRNIKYLRSENNLDQQSFGSLFNVTRDVIGTYERGKSTPPVDLIQSICSHFQISIDNFINKQLDSLGDKGHGKGVSGIINFGADDNSLSEDVIQQIANVVVLNKDAFYKNNTFSLFFEREVAKGVNEELKAIIREQQGKK